MPLLLTEGDVDALLTMPDAMVAVEDAFRALGRGGDGTDNLPRTRFFLPHGVLHQMAATLPGKGVMGTKTYTSFGETARFYILLFSTDTGELLALIEGNRLGQIRTGAATGVAARFMARPDAHKAALLGTGWQAQAQAEAVLTARPDLREFQVYSRDFGRREAFCREMTARLGIRFTPLASAEEAVRGTDMVVCATTAREPVLKGEWLRPGDFVAAVGANRLTAREIDEDVVTRANVVVVDDIEQARSEAAELVFAYERRKWSWTQARTLAQIVTGQAAGRTAPDDITLFKSLGVAIEDMAVAARVYERAQETGAGRDL